MSSAAIYSAIANDKHVRMLPQLQRNEIKIGNELLGRGGFYNVFTFDIPRTVQSSTRGTGPLRNGQYAIKCMRKDVVQNEKKYARAVKDIYTETHFLSFLDHPNILKIRGLVPCKQTDLCTSTDATGQDAGYLIVVDLLLGTLTKKLDHWRTDSHSLRGKFGKRKKLILRSQLHLAYELSEALDYLHRLNIMYRDLKPENIGFDVHGTVKIFDFGLAKDLRAYHDEHNDGLYNLSMAGTPRYMAPEIIRGERYNKSVDIYSYGILLWEIFTLKKAFEGWPWGKIQKQAMSKGVVLNMPTNLTPCIKSLITKSCSFNLRDRPCFNVVSLMLRMESRQVDGSGSTTENVGAELGNSMKRQHESSMSLPVGQ